MRLPVLSQNAKSNNLDNYNYNNNKKKTVKCGIITN